MSKLKRLVIQKRVNSIVAAQRAERYANRKRLDSYGPYGNGMDGGTWWEIRDAYAAGFRAGLKRKNES